MFFKKRKDPEEEKIEELEKTHPVQQYAGDEDEKVTNQQLEDAIYEINPDENTLDRG